MASCSDLIENLQEELVCPICKEYFENPVSIECGHSFCQSCLLKYCQETSFLFTCSECGSISQVREFQNNVPLGKLAAIAKKLRSHCLQNPEGHAKGEVHQEVQKRFCGIDRRPICVSCSQSKEHEAHILYCIDETAEEFRGTLQETVNDLRRNNEQVVQKLAKEKILLKMVEEEIETQKKNILFEFQKIQSFLTEEKNKCLSTVQTQGRANLDILKKSIGELSNQNQELRKRITELEEECKKSDVDLLQNMTGVVKRNKSVLDRQIENFHIEKIVCPIPGIIKAISSFKVDITLDPNTAGSGLIISGDLKSVSYEGIEENSGGFKDMVIVLGTQTFLSKRCYWEVKMPGNTCSCVGVCKISPSLENFALMVVPENNCCSLYAIAEHHIKFLQVSESNLKVGIFLDYDHGELSFYHLRKRYLIYTFPTISFSGPLRPLFALSKKVLMNDGSLTICS